MDAQNGGPGKRNVSCGVRPTPGPPLGRPSPTWLGAKGLLLAQLDALTERGGGMPPAALWRERAG